LKLLVSLIKRNKAVLFFLYIPILTYILFGLFVYQNPLLFTKEILNLSFVYLGVISLIFAVANTLLSRYFAIIIYVFLSFLVLVKISFYTHYNSVLTASAFYIVFETYTTELKEFLENYLSIRILLLIASLIFILLYTIIFKFDKLIVKPPKQLSKVKFRCILLLIFLASTLLINYKFSKENILLLAYSAHKDYMYHKIEINNLFTSSKSDIFGDVKKSNTAQTHIVVIGESISRQNMQLYGYNRETNPLLSKLASELNVFSKVRSPHVNTLTSLEKIFTLSSLKNNNPKKNGTLVQLANNAGYKTYWISNQQPIGFYETVSFSISQACDKKYFTNTNHGDEQAYDEVIFSKLDKVLSNKDENRVVFIHLIGAHYKYSNKYPEAFNYFYDNDYMALNKTKDGAEIVNAYDNAVRYNDFVIFNIIDKLKKENLSSTLTYFSDHGEDVYLTNENIVGHDLYHATEPMYQVPFLLWMSEKYSFSRGESIKSMNANLNKKYILDEFIHSFADIATIKFDSYVPEKSIFHKNYKEE